jgi:hypothetical protein
MVFRLGQHEWEGPVAFTFYFFRKHTKTARYKCKENVAFDFYAPLFMINGLSEDEIPESLQVIMGKSPFPPRTMGFLSEPRPLRIESDFCEYEFDKDYKNSIRYNLTLQLQTYALYIPNEVFEGFPHPKRVFVKMGVLGED